MAWLQACAAATVQRAAEVAVRKDVANKVAVLKAALEWSPDGGLKMPDLLRACSKPLSQNNVYTRLGHVWKSIEITKGTSAEAAMLTFNSFWKVFGSSQVAKQAKANPAAFEALVAE